MMSQDEEPKKSFLSKINFTYSVKVGCSDVQQFLSQLVRGKHETDCVGRTSSWLIVCSLAKLPSHLRSQIHVGSRVERFTALDESSTMFGTKSKEIRSRDNPKRIDDFDTSNANFVRIDFWSDLIPMDGRTPFCLDDSFSLKCMRSRCNERLSTLNRSHCRCCGILVCRKCSKRTISLTNTLKIEKHHK